MTEEINKILADIDTKIQSLQGHITLKGLTDDQRKNILMAIDNVLVVLDRILDK